MKSIIDPRNTEKVLPQPVGAFTSPDFLSIICCQVSSWNWKGWLPWEASQVVIILYPGVVLRFN